MDALRRWKAGMQKPRNAARDKMLQAFEVHQVEFLNREGPGIPLRLRPFQHELDQEANS